jgi:phage gp46-like protein
MIFIDNKYTRTYNRILTRAKTLNLGKGPGRERHHIIPRSLNGDNTKDNLVYITTREHFICHLLLTKMVTGKDRYRMLQAAAAFSSWTTKSHSREAIGSRIYQMLKQEKSKVLVELWTTTDYREQALSGLVRLTTDVAHKAAMSLIRKELWKNPEYLDKMKSRRKTFKKVEIDDVLYNSLTEAASFLKLDPSTISKRCSTANSKFSTWKYM